MTTADSSAFPPVPPILYRYRPPTDLDKGRVREVLLQDTMFAAAPDSFNDPFDCQMRIDWEAPADRWLGYYEKAVRRDRGLRGDAARREARRLMLEQRASAEGREELRAAFQRDLNMLGVLCFCDTSNNILLWSHYAEKHEGFCLEFDHGGSRPFSDAVPVRYAIDEAAPTVGPLVNEHEAMESTLLTKAPGWAYEREWRILFPRSGWGPKTFEPGALKSVIVGCRASARLIDGIEEIMAQRTTRLPIRRAVMAANAFRLEVPEV